MKIADFAKELDMKILTDKGLEKEINRLYICDLLSWVMSHGSSGSGWITVLTHMNIVAVALLVDIPCIIIPENIEVDVATLKKASEEEIVILSSSMDAYEIAKKAGMLL